MDVSALEFIFSYFCDIEDNRLFVRDFSILSNGSFVAFLTLDFPASSTSFWIIIIGLVSFFSMDVSKFETPISFN